MEKLDDKQSSENGEVRYVSRADFATAAKALARTDTKAAVYTHPGPSPLEKINFSYPIIDFFGDEILNGVSSTPAELYALIAIKRQGLITQNARKPFAHETFAELMNFLNALEKEFRDMLKGFEGYLPYGVLFRFHNPTTSGESFAQNTHSDMRRPNRNTIILTRTIYGPSTVYKSTHGTNIYPPEATLCAHTGNGIEHRSPIRYEYNFRPRFTIVLAIQSAAQTRR